MRSSREAMIPAILLRLEFGWLCLRLSSNEVNGLSDYHWGRADRTSIFHVMRLSSLDCSANPLVSMWPFTQTSTPFLSAFISLVWYILLLSSARVKKALNRIEFWVLIWLCSERYYIGISSFKYTPNRICWFFFFCTWSIRDASEIWGQRNWKVNLHFTKMGRCKIGLKRQVSRVGFWTCLGLRCLLYTQEELLITLWHR